MRRSSLLTRLFSNLPPTGHGSFSPPLELSKSPSIIVLCPPSPSAFSVTILVTIERIAHATFAHTVPNQLLDIPPLLVSLSNATFVVDGDILLISVPSECAVCDQHGHIADDCPIETLSVEQATHIYAGTSSAQPGPPY